MSSADDFLNRFQVSKQTTQRTTSTTPYNNTNTNSNPNPRPQINEEPGQPLARAGPSPEPTPIATDFQPDQPKDVRPIFTSLLPDAFGQDWKQPLNPGLNSPSSPPKTVQGNSRTTWAGLNQPKTRVHLASEGRPVSANVQVWSGPNNVPSKMKIYSEDGAARPWNAAFATLNTNGGPPALDVKNTGPLEFPMQVSVAGETQQSPSAVPDSDSPVAPVPVQGSVVRTSATDKWDKSIPSQSETVHGGSLGYFSLDGSTQRVLVEIASEGLPIYCTVELWQGPGNIKQLAEIYTDHGLLRPWSAIIETPGYQCTIAIANIGPMEYPLTATVKPIA